MNRLTLYIASPPFMHVGRLGEGRPPLGSILLVDLADRPATSEELRSIFCVAPWCPVCVLLGSVAERRRIPRSPRMCSVSSLIGGGGASSILSAVRERPRPAPMELAEWLADRVRCSGLRAPLATLFGRAISNARPALGSTWSETPLAALGGWTAARWQEVARLADLAANREAMGRLLVKRNAAGAQAVRSIQDLLGATEDEFRERAGWEWVLEAAIRQASEQRIESVAPMLGSSREVPADVARIPAAITADWPRTGHLADAPMQRVVGH